MFNQNRDRLAAAQRLCLLSEDMQNRRIINRLAAPIGLSIKPTVVSNSVLALCSHLRHGEWVGIATHTFFHVFGGSQDLVAADLVDPVRSQTIGLVLSDRSPPTPMARGVPNSIVDVDFDAELTSAMLST